MLFKYKALTKKGAEQSGSIETLNRDTAIRSLQERGFTIVSISGAEKAPFWEKRIKWFERIPNKDVVILSRHIATLFSAQISALRAFRLLGKEAENVLLREVLTDVADDIQGGSSISDALAKHPSVFSDFYVNMVRAGEETGKMNEAFEFLADYLDRSYALIVKTKNALIYPAFVIATFIIVMVLMLTMVFPRLASVLVESGQDIPAYTQAIILMSNFLVDYGVFLLILLVLLGIWLVRFSKSERGKRSLGRIEISIPIIGPLIQKFYLSRIADNMHTMLSSGIPMVRALEITSAVVGNAVYKDIIEETTESVRTGSTISASFSKHKEIPGIMTQIMRIGEETGELGNILETLSNFYRREVDNAVDTLVGLIEPILIVSLGLGVGILLASVLIPIYNLSSAF